MSDKWAQCSNEGCKARFSADIILARTTTAICPFCGNDAWKIFPKTPPKRESKRQPAESIEIDMLTGKALTCP